VLVADHLAAGRHAVALDGATLPPSVYFLQVRTDDGYAQTERITFVE
jgi:hypothetical protein